MKSLPHFAAVAVALLLLGADQERSDLEAIQGTWELQSLQSGDPPMKRGPKQMTFAFAGEKLTMKIQLRESQPEISVDYTFSIDPNKRPAEIDVTGPFRRQEGARGPEPDGGVEPETANDTAAGIYRVDGGQLQLALPMQRLGQRPTELKPGKDVQLLTFKRQKADQ